MPKVLSLDIDLIRLDSDSQARASIDEGTVEEYREALDGGASFGPVEVYHDGSDYWAADGFHRILAFRRAGRRRISALVHEGGKREAILHAVGANATHGLKRTNADKRRAVAMMLNDPEWAKLSDGEIARRCVVSQPFVSSIRRDIAASTQNVLSCPTRKGGDGRTVDVSNIGRKSASAAGPSGPLSPAERMSFEEAKRTIVQCAADLVQMGKAAMELREILGPDGFEEWLSAEYPGREDVIRDAMTAAESGDGDTGAIISCFGRFASIIAGDGGVELLR